MMMITSPIVVPNFLLKYNAKTSVPSITAPPLIDKPIPAPKKKPPKPPLEYYHWLHSGSLHWLKPMLNHQLQALFYCKIDSHRFVPHNNERQIDKRN